MGAADRRQLDGRTDLLYFRAIETSYPIDLSENMPRPKGSKNKRKALSALELEALRAADPRTFLQDAMKNPALDLDTRIDAARALLPYHHAKKAPEGQNEALSKIAAIVVKYV